MDYVATPRRMENKITTIMKFNQSAVLPLQKIILLSLINTIHKKDEDNYLIFGISYLLVRNVHEYKNVSTKENEIISLILF